MSKRYVILWDHLNTSIAYVEAETPEDALALASTIPAQEIYPKGIELRSITICDREEASVLIHKRYPAA